MIPGTWLDRTEETIVAPATPRGRGALAVVRLSGPGSLAILKRLVRLPHGHEDLSWPPRHVRRVQVVDGETVIDEALATFFQGPESYTGQDVAELSLHGSPLIVEEAVRLACACGARPAQPGEFTLRAVLHGKMDLIQAEAVDQATRAASRTALQCVARQLAGQLSARIAQLKTQVVEALAALEMALDFPEEDDAPLPVEQLLVQTAAAGGRAAALRDEAERARTVLDREAVVICGPPNAGKSTLFNALLGVDRAIVAGQPGTTRDALFAPLAIGGQLVDVVDTAGLRVSDDAVEAEGVRRAWRHLREALVVVLVGDATGAACPAAEWERLELRVRDACAETVVVSNKSDLLGPGARPECAGLRVSALTGEGVEALRRAVEACVERAAGAEEAPEFRPTERQADLCRRIAAALDDASRGLAEGAPGEAVAVDLRRALDLLQELLGERVEADVLGEIFARFCIGM